MDLAGLILEILWYIPDEILLFDVCPLKSYQALTLIIASYTQTPLLLDKFPIYQMESRGFTNSYISARI